MNDLEQLIAEAVELEGLLRVMRDRRDDTEAVALARAKAAAIAAALAETHDTTAPVTTAPAPCEPPVTGDMPAALPAEAPAEPVASDPLQAAPAAAVIRDLRRHMTINDRFRFRRELFGGSDEELNDTLDLLSAMRSMDEVDEYLFDDLAWDPGDPVVKEFRSIVGGAFNQR